MGRSETVLEVVAMVLVLVLCAGHGEELPVAEAEPCARMRNEAPEDTTSGFPTFVAARPSVLLDVSRCAGPPAAPRVNFAAQHAGGRARAVFAQGGFDAGAVIDGIAGESNNGWAYHGRLDEAILTIALAPEALAPGGAAAATGASSSEGTGDNSGTSGGSGVAGTGEAAGAGGFRAGRIVIVSGSGLDDHHLTAFRVWALAPTGSSGGEPAAERALGMPDGGEEADGWTRIPGLTSQHPDVKVAEDSVSVTVKAGLVEVVLDFPPLLMSALRLKVDDSDADANKNAIINEIEVLSHDSMARDATAVMTVYVDDAPMGAPRHITLPPPPSDPAPAASGATLAYMHRIWLPNEAGVHEVRVELGGAISEMHVTIYEKLSVGLHSHIAFPPPGYTFGRAMLPFIRVGADGFQCLGGQALDNSTGGCWTQQDTYYTTLDIVPIEDTGIDLQCHEWEESEDVRHCSSICGGVNRAKGSRAVGGAMTRCCDYSNYKTLMRSSRYIGLSCLPEGEFLLVVRFYDYYKVYAGRHQVNIVVDRDDMGLWYHRGGGGGHISTPCMPLFRPCAALVVNSAALVVRPAARSAPCRRREGREEREKREEKAEKAERTEKSEKLEREEGGEMEEREATTLAKGAAVEGATGAWRGWRRR
jgi:hypothetical protein